MLTRLAPWILATLVASQAGAATSSVALEFSGVTNRCASIDIDPPYAVTFADPSPQGALVTSVSVVLHGYDPATPAAAATVTVAGTSVGNATISGGSCECGVGGILECTTNAVTGPSHPGGWPGWSYGGSNLLEVSVSSGGPIALDRAVVTVTYSFCGNRAAEPGEQCDDGDSDWCDGCTPQCLLLDPACDDANPVTQDSCQTATGCAHAAPPIPALPYWR